MPGTRTICARQACFMQKDCGSHLHLALERGAVLQAVIAGEPADEFPAHPVVEDAADILARDPRHGGEVALRYFLANENAPAADVVAEGFGKAEQSLRDTA